MRKIRKIAIGLLSFCVCALLGLGTFFTLDTAKASAAISAEVQVAGASLRVPVKDGEGNYTVNPGIKFHTEISTEYFSNVKDGTLKSGYKTGLLILPTTLLNKSAYDVLTVDNATGLKAINVDTTEYWELKDGVMQANVMLNYLNGVGYGTDLTVRAYVYNGVDYIYSDGGESGYSFSFVALAEQADENSKLDKEQIDTIVEEYATFTVTIEDENGNELSQKDVIYGEKAPMAGILEYVSSKDNTTVWDPNRKVTGDTTLVVKTSYKKVELGATEVDLDVTAANNALTTSASLAFDLSSLNMDAFSFGSDYTITSLTVGGELATATGATVSGSMLTIPASNFPYAYGEKEVSLVLSCYGSTITLNTDALFISKKISDKAELDGMNTIMSAYNANGKGYAGYYQMDADVTYNESISLASLYVWTPAISDYSTDGFIGTFDGCGHVIENFHLGHSKTHGFITEIGVGGVLKNLAFRNAVFGGVNSLITGANYGEVENVYAHVAAFGSWSAAPSGDKAQLTSYYDAGNTGSSTAIINGGAWDQTGSVKNLFVDLTEVREKNGETWRTNQYVAVTTTSCLKPFGKPHPNAVYEGMYLIGAPANLYRLAHNKKVENTDLMARYVDRTAFDSALANNENIAKEVNSWPIWMKDLMGLVEVKEFETRQDVNLDLLANGKVVSTNEAATAVIDLSEAGDVTEVQSVTYNGNSVEYSLSGTELSISVDEFGMAFGDATITVITNTGKFLVPVRLVSKVIKTAADLDAMNYIAKACGSVSGEWNGYFQLGNNIQYNGNWVPMNDFSMGRVLPMDFVDDLTADADGYAMYNGRYLISGNKLVLLSALQVEGAVVDTGSKNWAQAGWGTGNSVKYNNTWLYVSNSVDKDTLNWAARGEGFIGTFDGCGYAIDGVKVGVDMNYSGFFGQVGNGALIKNVAFTNAEYHAVSMGGFLACFAKSGSVAENVYIQLTHTLNGAGSAISATDNFRSHDGLTLRNVIVDASTITVTSSQYFVLGGSTEADKNTDGVADTYTVYQGAYAIVNNETQKTNAYGKGGIHANSTNHGVYVGAEAFAAAYAEDANLQETFDLLYEMFGDTLAMGSSIPEQATLEQQKLYLNAYVEEGAAKVAEDVVVNVSEVANNLTTINSLTYGETAIEGAAVSGGILTVPTGSAITVETYGAGENLVLNATDANGKEYTITVPTFFVTSVITTKAELEAFNVISAAAESEANTYGGYFELGADIVLNETMSFGNSSLYKWMPAFYGIDTNGFVGTFDGCGYVIDGMIVGADPSSAASAFITEIGKGGALKNVAFTNAVVGNSRSVITVCNAGTVENVYVHMFAYGASISSSTGTIYEYNDGWLGSGTAIINGNAWEATGTINNLFVDMSDNTAWNESSKVAAGSVRPLGNPNPNAVYNGVYVVGVPTDLNKLASNKAESDMFAGFTDFVEFKTTYEENAVLAEKVEENSVIRIEADKTVNYKYADTNKVVATLDADLKTNADHTVVSTTARGQIDLGATLGITSGTLVAAKYNGVDMNGAFEGGILTVDMAPFGTEFGEETIDVSFAGEQISHTFSVKVNVVTNIITTAEELQDFGYVARLVGTTRLPNGYFELGADINFNGEYVPYTGRGGKGDYTGWDGGLTTGFKGTFDGCGFTISNMTMVSPVVSVFGGFIPVLHKEGIIKNVAFKGAQNKTNNGGYVVGAGSGTIENVYVQFVYASGNTYGVLYGIDNGNNAGDIIINNVLVDTTAITTNFSDGRPVYAIGGAKDNKTIGIVSNAYAITGTAAQAAQAFGLQGATSKTNAGAYCGTEAFAKAYWADDNMKATVDAISEYFGLGLDFSAYEPTDYYLEAQNFDLGVDNTATMNNSEATVDVASAAAEFGALGSLASVTLAQETNTYALRSTAYEVQGATLVDNKLTIPFAGNEEIFSATKYGDYTLTIVTNLNQTIIAPVSVVSQIIDTREKLIAFGEIATAIGNANGNSYDGYFKLGSDIAYSEGTLTELTGNGKFNFWRPWLTTLDTDGFNGIFDGNGYSINGLIIGCLGTTTEQAFITEIGTNGVLRNIAFTNMVIGGASSGITELNNGLVEDVYVHVRALGGWISGSNEGYYTNYNYGWCGPTTAVINGAASYASGTIRNMFVDMADTLITTADGGKTTDESGNPVIHKEVTDGVNVGNWAADPEEIIPLGLSDRATYENIYVIGIPETEKYAVSKTLKRAYLYWCETAEEFVELCTERTQIRNIIESNFNNSSWKIVNGVPYFKYASVNAVIGEIDLDLNVSHETGITYGNSTSEIRLSDGNTDFGTLVSVYFGDTEIPATYNAERQLLCFNDNAGFGTAYGEQTIEITFADDNGLEHTFSVGVLLISKKISDKAELDMMGMIAKMYGTTTLKWDGYFVLDNNIDYGGNTWKAFIDPSAGTKITDSAFDSSKWTKSYDGYYLYNGSYVVKGAAGTSFIPYVEGGTNLDFSSGTPKFEGSLCYYAKNATTGAVLGWGTDADYRGFFGTFDGRGYTISNMKTPSLGAFISVLNGTIKNVSFEGANVSAASGVIAMNGHGTIENVYVQLASVGTSSTDGAGALFFSSNRAVHLNLINCFVDASQITVASNNAGTIGSIGKQHDTENTLAYSGSMSGVYGVVGAEGVLGIRDANLPSGQTGAANLQYTELKNRLTTLGYKVFVTKAPFLTQVNTYGSDVYDAIVTYPQWMQDQILGEGYDFPEAPVNDPNGEVFVDGGETEFVLVVGTGKLNAAHYSTVEEKALRLAADFLVEQVKLATGATIKMEFAPKTWDASKKMIVLGDWNLFNQTNTSLNDGDYGVIRVNNSVFIMADNAADYQTAAIKFLEEVLGYRAYAADSLGSNKTKLNEKGTEFIQDPSFDGFIEYLNVANNTVAMPTAMSFTNDGMFNYRQSGTYSIASGEQGYVMGIQEYDGKIYGAWHNTFEFVDPTQSYTVNGNTYGTWASTISSLTGVYSKAGNAYTNFNSASYTTVSHPWYATNKQIYYTRSGSIGSYTWPSNITEVVQSSSEAYQLCFTAHGNATAYTDLVALVGNEMIARANAHPEYDIFGFTQQDNHWACACNACTAKGNPSDTILAFLDDVLAYVNGSAELKRPAIKIAYFAYAAYLAAPTSYDYDGTEGSVDFNPNTYLVLAPIGAYYDEIMNTGKNLTTDAWPNSKNSAWGADWSDMVVWLSKSAASDVQIYLWMYELNQYEWFTTRNSFKANIGNIRLFAEYGNIDLIQIENMWHQANGSAFSQLKAYINSQAMMEVNKYVTVTDGMVDETSLNAYYETLVNEFFGRNADGTFTGKGYYGPAGNSMYNYYQAQQAVMAYFDGNGEETGKQARWCDFDWSGYTHADYRLANWITHLNKAYEYINNASLTDEQKAVYLERVKIESLTYRWLVCKEKTTVPSSLLGVSYADLTAFRTAFLQDVKALGYAYYASGADTTLYSIENEWLGTNTIFTVAPVNYY